MRMYALEVAVGDSRKSNASTTNLTALNHFSKKKKQVIIMLISVCLRKWKRYKAYENGEVTYEPLPRLNFTILLVYCICCQKVNMFLYHLKILNNVAVYIMLDVAK